MHAHKMFIFSFLIITFVEITSILTSLFNIFTQMEVNFHKKSTYLFHQFILTTSVEQCGFQ
jgi:hypothetical protein